MKNLPVADSLSNVDFWLLLWEKEEETGLAAERPTSGLPYLLIVLKSQYENYKLIQP